MTALRFRSLARRTEGISPKVLSRKVSELERDGILRRQIPAVDPPAVEYSLPKLGAELALILQPLRAWRENRFEQIEDARRSFDAEQRDLNRAPWQTARMP